MSGKWKHSNNRPMMKINKGDCNDLARQDADKRTKPPSKQYCDNYDLINWRSKQRKAS